MDGEERNQRHQRRADDQEARFQPREFDDAAHDDGKDRRGQPVGGGPEADALALGLPGKER